MKLAHLADLHLGFRQYGRQTSKGINQREADVATAFRRALDDVIATSPDIVVIAGDVFHSVRPTNPAILDAFNQFQRLRRELPEVPVVVVAGNHDTPRSVETGTILSLFEAIPNVHAIVREPRSIRFEQLDLSVTGFPRASLAAAERPAVLPDSAARWNVLLLHGEIAGVVPGDRTFAQNAGTVMEPGELHAERWDYVALGHYHVACEVFPNAWYAGSVEYVSNNPWAETREGSALVPEGAKGWLRVTLADGPATVDFRPVPLARRHIDLQPVFCQGMTAAEVDVAIAERVNEVEGGIDDQILRQVLYDIPRAVVRDLDHAAIREFKTRALHYRFDARRPQPIREVGVGPPGKRQTVSEMVEEYLTKCPVSPGIDRSQLIALGREYMSRVERDLAEA